MKKGRTGPKSLALAIAGTSRLYQRPLSGRLARRKRPCGSLRRSKPSTRTLPSGHEAPFRRPSGTKPRLMRMSPASVCKGVITQYPAPRSVSACTRVARSWRNVPLVQTGRYSSCGNGLTLAAGTGACLRLTSTRSIRSSFHRSRSTCQKPSAPNPTAPIKHNAGKTKRAARPRVTVPRSSGEQSSRASCSN